mgnify:CR=1 FL=1
MSETREDIIEYGILFVFDNGATHQEWYSDKSNRDFAFGDYIINNAQDERKILRIGDIMLNKEHFLYAKKIERTKKDIRVALGL